MLYFKPASTDTSRSRSMPFRQVSRVEKERYTWKIWTRKPRPPCREGERKIWKYTSRVSNTDIDKILRQLLKSCLYWLQPGSSTKSLKISRKEEKKKQLRTHDLTTERSGSKHKEKPVLKNVWDTFFHFAFRQHCFDLNREKNVRNN